MSNGALRPAEARNLSETGHTRPYVTMMIGEQLFGLPAAEVEDAHILSNITPVPLASPEVAGVLNIRGNIVTAIDLARCLGLEPHDTSGENNSIVVEYRDAQFGLLVDEIKDVVNLDPNDLEECPQTLDPSWKEVAVGIFRVEGDLMIIASVEQLMEQVG